MLILNNPNNPTGKLYTKEELEAIATLAEKHDVLVIADEVYEWQVYPGREMIRFGRLRWWTIDQVRSFPILIGQFSKLIGHYSSKISDLLLKVAYLN